MRALIGLMLLCCTTLTWSAPPKRANDDNLTQSWAAYRRAQVKKVHYELVLEFQKGATTYDGKLVLLTELAQTKDPLTLDFKGDKIRTLKVNDQELKNYPVRRGSFDIPARFLAVNNKIEVIYTNSFSREASGVQRSVDPEDQAEYIFSDFEPYYAHTLFPCFDQPDIKATYQLTVKAPRDWKAIHNEIASNVVTEGERSTTFFPITKPISTYLFFVGVGPFAEWKDSYQGLPLVLYARQTLAKYVDAENFFATTKKGLAFYNQYFGTPYPFSQYGQILIPEFAWGGMENPGAVALNERNIFRGPVTQSRIEDRDNLILHEMAHMWFGDLVTMRWWNDLWLNESFATYLASIAQDRVMGSKATWQDFFQTKTWGHWQDQLVTTHPIETDVEDVRTAKGNFDGITYAKGASSLKQLHFFVQEEAFKQGLQSYFKTYAFQNTTREDFINQIAKAAQRPLADWTKKWLQTAGLNRVKVKPVCENGLLTSLTLEQQKSASGNFLPHRVRLGFYEVKNNELSLFRTQDVIYDTASTPIKELEGTRCPDFILPNQDDQDYALFALDEKSLKEAKLALTKLPDPLSRLMVWNMLAQMVRDLELKPLDYFAFVQAGLAVEQDDLLLGGLIAAHSTVAFQYGTYLTKEQRAEVAPQLEGLLWERLTHAPPASSLQMMFFDFYVSVAQTPESMQKLLTMLKTNTPPAGITLDQDRRWSVLSALVANGSAEGRELIEEEKKRDPSTLGLRQAYAAVAAFPNAKNKAFYWEDFRGNKDLPFSNFRMASGRFHSSNFPELSQPYVDQFFKTATTKDWGKDDTAVEPWFENLFPGRLCTGSLAQRSKRELGRARNLTPLARRAWREAQDELERCVRVRASANVPQPKG